MFYETSPAQIDSLNVDVQKRITIIFSCKPCI